jgi:hypothetical protein
MVEERGFLLIFAYNLLVPMCEKNPSIDIFMAPTCTSTIIIFEPCALNVKFSISY